MTHRIVMSGYAADWETLSQKYISWLRFEKNLSANTVEGYTHDLELLREYMSRHGDLLPAEVEATHIEGLMSEVYDSGFETTSQARILSGLRSFFTFLQIAGICQTSPLEFVDTPKARRKLPDVLSVDEIDAIIGSLDLSEPQGHRNKAMLETLYSCGLRVTELITLKLSDLFFDDGFIRVTGKGNKQRLVPINSTVCKNIGIWLEQRRLMTPDPRCSDLVFLNRNGRKLTRVMIFTIIKRATEAAGIGKDVSPHTFRHSFATHLLAGGASIRQVQELLGHESIMTTEIYTHLDRTHLRESIEKHHPLG